MGKKKWLLCLIFVVISLLIFLHVRLYQYAFDDAFIHFRVARNFFETGYPYYNIGEMLKVSTSSGWVVFLTTLFGIAKTFGIESSFPLFISVMNALILFGNLYVYTKIIDALSKEKLSANEKILFQIPYIALLLPSSIGLMETPLALLIAGWGIYGVIRSKASGFAFLGLAIYFRIELLILLFFTIFIVWVYKKVHLRQIIIYSVLGSIFFTLFDLYFFRTIIPHSVIAKSIVYSLRVSDSLLSLFGAIPIVLEPSERIFLGIMVTTILSVFLLTGLVLFRESKTLPLADNIVLFYLWGLGVFIFYISERVLVFDWYTPLFMVPLLVASFVSSFSIKRPENLILKIPVLIFFLLSSVSVIRTISASIDVPNSFFLFESGSRVKQYLKIGQIINDEMPNATLLTSEIGGLGYSFQGKVFDAAGLASLDALDFHPMEVPEERQNGTVGAIPLAYVKNKAPDVIVSYDRFAQTLFSDSEISALYNIIVLPAYLPEDSVYSENKAIWGDKYMRVYIQKNLPVPDEMLSMQISE